MPKKKAPEEVSPLPANIPRPRLHKLTICNFRGIGTDPVSIELDDIVVLVGPNNAGKSSILRAYEVVMEHGSAEGALTLDDFPNGQVSPGSSPTIELDTVVFEKTAPGERWVRCDGANQDMFVREKWTWDAPGKPKKVGWDVAAGNWHASEGPWGAPNVAQAYRPKPHRVTAFDDPAKQADAIAKLLHEAIKDRIANLSKNKAESSGGGEPSEYEKLIRDVGALRKSIALEATNAVEDVRSELGRTIAEVFPGYSVSFDARPEDDVEKCISFFKEAPILKMGVVDGYQVGLDHQGSGARRTLLWAALRVLAERPSTNKTSTALGRPHILLLDEPELCLHPNAIREACRVLYDLPKSKSWQVMVTTHSPVFIDLSRDNTSVARVERSSNGQVTGTTIFRPSRAKLDDDDKVELKLLNLCDPYVAEFFFGGRTILVEGDTEYTAFRYVASCEGSAYADVHIVRARGKACLVSLCKILNQFDKGYAVLHDSDRPVVINEKTKVTRKNGAWTLNERISYITEDRRKQGSVRLLASVPNFEEAFFGEEVSTDKPFSALAHLKMDSNAYGLIKQLLDALLDAAKSVPAGALEWGELSELEVSVTAFEQTTSAPGETAT
ncbi:MAG: AAA family ATPase [Rudaea sp.]